MIRTHHGNISRYEKTYKRALHFFVMFIVGLVIYSQTLLGIIPEWLWKRRFSDEQRPVSHQLNVGNRTIQYVDTEDEGKPVLLFIHGSPGSWTAFEDYFKDDTLREAYRIISVDRPGFGFSGLGKPELSVVQQAEDIAAIFDSIPSDTPIVLVGHSYGGPVAAIMAMQQPDRISHLILLAGSTDPELEETKYIQQVIRWPIINLLVPPFVYSTNEEIIALKAGLEEMLSDWKKITADVTIIHGDADPLVPVENAEFSKRMLINAKSVTTIRKKDMNHFLIWNQYDLVVKRLLEIAKGL